MRALSGLKGLSRREVTDPRECHWSPRIAWGGKRSGQGFTVDADQVAEVARIHLPRGGLRTGRACGERWRRGPWAPRCKRRVNRRRLQQAVAPSRAGHTRRSTRATRRNRKPGYHFLLVGILPVALLFARCSKQEDTARRDIKNVPSNADADLKPAGGNLKRGAADMADHAKEADHSAADEFTTLVADFQKGIDNVDADSKNGEASVKSGFDKLDSHVEHVQQRPLQGCAGHLGRHHQRGRHDQVQTLRSGSKALMERRDGPGVSSPRAAASSWRVQPANWGPRHIRQ